MCLLRPGAWPEMRNATYAVTACALRTTRFFDVSDLCPTKRTYRGSRLARTRRVFTVSRATPCASLTVGDRCETASRQSRFSDRPRTS